MRAVVQGLPGEGAAHQLLVASLFTKLTPPHFKGASGRGGEVGVGQGGQMGGCDERLAGILCAVIECCHGSTLVRAGGGGGGEGGGVTAMDVTGGMLDMALQACHGVYSGGGKGGGKGGVLRPVGDVVPHLRGLVCVPSPTPPPHLAASLSLSLSLSRALSLFLTTCYPAFR